MAGMLQIITYVLAIYLVLKGVEILQIALASSRPNRTGIIAFAVVVLGACIVAAFILTFMQDMQALKLQAFR